METLLSLYNQVSIKDILDILLVSFLIYQGLLIVHGTRAVQMLLGVGGLIGLFWVGHTFQLYSLNWILDHFFDSFFIIAIILFQDQFRNALASFGTGRNLFSLRQQNVENLEIDEIVEVVTAMGRESIGALIVIERTQGLANFKATGTSLNSLIHADIIYAIFQSSSPLHDGAVIISRGKLASAGCFLPLTRNSEIERHLGTRHRAALGVTEDTDAVAITVSEETGKVNISVYGTFYTCDSSKDLRKYLKHLLIGEKLDDALNPIHPKGSLS